MDQFTDEVALQAGGWDPRFSRVLATAVVGSTAIAIIDSNSQDSEVGYENTDSYEWMPGLGWRGRTSGGGLANGWIDGVVVISGTGLPGDTVLIEFRDEPHQIAVQSSGYWLFAAAGSDDETPPKRVNLGSRRTGLP